MTLTRKLGRSNIEVSAIGMGCWAIGGPWTFYPAEEEPHPAGWSKVDDDESIRAIHAALDMGITLFDTAANYGAGHSERLLGKAVEGRRDKVVIATKFGYLVDEEAKVIREDHSQVLQNIRQDCENNLRRLNTDYIDLYQLHDGDYEPENAVAVRDELETLVKEGKIRAYGWSTDDVERSRVFTEGENCAAIQFTYHAFSQKFAIRDLLKEFDLAGISRSPLAMGTLTGKFAPDTTFPDDDVRRELNFQEGRPALYLQWIDRMRDVLTANGHTLAQATLSWILTSDERIIPIPGFKTVEQVEENVKTLEKGLLSMDQMTRIEGMRAAHIDTVQAFYNPPQEAGE
jgi:aryl-alcohol dehydrogenase-like predicted oxidoreductase